MYHHFLLFTSPQRYSHPTPYAHSFFCEIFAWFIPPSLPCIGFFLMILDALLWCNFGLVRIFVVTTGVPLTDSFILSVYLSNAYPTLLLLLARLPRLLVLCTDVHRRRHQTKTKKHGYCRLALDLYIHTPYSHSSLFLLSAVPDLPRIRQRTFVYRYCICHAHLLYDL
ncbi:hypothetical protein IW262DRAFT_998903 [Armillaria fumosa]|nr:hypothetical protein IW262DRAFT_998903 [Armillaria fumosa]